MHSCKPDDWYNDIIAQPPSRKTVSNRENEVQTEDEQSFLARQLQILQQNQQGQGQQQTRSVSPMRTPQSAGKTSPRTPSSGGSPNKKVNCPVMIQQFFWNLKFH
jgi:dynein light intermediate chain 1